jgi:hypothetical protein
MGYKIKSYEALGGPLCGRRVARLKNMKRFYCTDGGGEYHFYRLIRVISEDGCSAATYYHYFGTDKVAAEKKGPTLLPGAHLYKPLSKNQ